MDKHDRVVLIVEFVNKNIKGLTKSSASSLYDIIENQLSKYAETYHAKSCEKCERTNSLSRKQYYPMGTEKIDEQCLSCDLQCLDDCPMDR